jgi:ribose transport system ATP-binding protein
MTTATRLELSHVSKRFGSNTVLNDVSFRLEAGHILGLIGQNGAGKSTLVKILAGLHPDYTGTVSIEGRAVHLTNPRQARAAGVAVIYQEFSLVSEMTVAENLLLGREPGTFGYSSRDTNKRAAQILTEVGIDIGVPLSTATAGLSPAMKQRIEIVKALAEQAKVLLMDEPTARLSNTETRWLFSTMRELAERGVGVIFISHFLEEILEVSDWITILRNGSVVASAPRADLKLETMTSLMLGEQLRGQLAERRGHSEQDARGPVVMEARDLSVGERLRDINLQVRSGEIVGVAGLVGSGRSRLCRALAGADRPTSGVLLLRGKPVRLRTPRHALNAGIALIPEDRKNQALSMVSSVKDNLVLMALQKGLGLRALVPVSRVNRLATRLVKQLEVSPPDINAPVSTLSGGNQQKVVVAKALATDPQVLIIDQPTAGVDVGTKAQLHRVLRNLADSGAALLVVSDDLDELFTLSDRLCVMRKGALAWEGPAAAMDREQLLQEISVTGSAHGIAVPADG